MSWVVTGTQKEPAGDPFFFSNVSLLLHGDGTNGSTVIRDSSSRMNTVTAFGNAQISTAQSKFGGASIAFDGSGDYLTAGSLTLDADFTIEFWLYPVTTSTGISAISIGNAATSTGVYIYYSSGVSSYAVYSTSRVIAGGSAFSGTFKHFALVRNSGSIKLYIDGANVGSAWSSSATFTGAITVGAGVENTIFPTSACYIDDLRITKGIARYTADFTPPTAPFPDI
jgi:hypothetical protein